jgi:hypothetical protein
MSSPSTRNQHPGNDSLPALPTNPSEASRLLLSLDEKAAAMLFQRLPSTEQLSIIEATPNPKKRESLYYLVPDCTLLVRESRVETLLEIVNTVFGTGLACGILSAVSAEQFSEMFERTSFKNGVIDPEIVALWVAELTELEPDELTTLLCAFDVELLGELFRGRVDVPLHYKGMVVASGLVELEQVEFDDEQARLMGELLWAADPDQFIQMLRFLISQDEEFSQTEEDDAYDEEDAESAAYAVKTEALPDLDTENLDELLPPSKKQAKP